MADCSSTDTRTCIDKTAALHLKLGGIAVILVASGLGVCMPLLGRTFAFLRPDRDSFFVVKAFAAGVILATAFIHMLPDAFETLGNACLPENPWGKYPFAGIISMFSALLTLLVDSWANAHYQNKNKNKLASSHDHNLPSPPPPPPPPPHTTTMTDVSLEKQEDFPIHSHSLMVAITTTPEEDAMSMQIRHRIISQVLEAGIIAHSVIIGISMGTSESPCIVRPLLAALTFHQFFEGVGLGGSIAQGGFKTLGKILMAFFFSVTTPLGIAIGIGIASSYRENSPTALLVEGIFDSTSAGILIYMSLVDLIAADFLSRRLQTNFKLQLYSYAALFCGAGSMSLLGYWA